MGSVLKPGVNSRTGTLLLAAVAPKVMRAKTVGTTIVYIGFFILSSPTGSMTLSYYQCPQFVAVLGNVCSYLKTVTLAKHYAKITANLGLADSCIFIPHEFSRKAKPGSSYPRARNRNQSI